MTIKCKLVLITKWLTKYLNTLIISKNNWQHKNTWTLWTVYSKPEILIVTLRLVTVSRRHICTIQSLKPLNWLHVSQRTVWLYVSLHWTSTDPMRTITILWISLWCCGIRHWISSLLMQLNLRCDSTVSHCGQLTMLRWWVDCLRRGLESRQNPTWWQK